MIQKIEFGFMGKSQDSRLTYVINRIINYSVNKKPPEEF